MHVNDIFMSLVTYKLIKENGKRDATAGKDMYAGWSEFAAEMGYTPNSRTLAREAYEDGWYSTSPK